jgi:hypothetical protein
MKRRSGYAISSLCMLCALAAWKSSSSLAQTPANSSPQSAAPHSADVTANAVLTQAVLIRALGIERPTELRRQLNSFPLGMVRGQARESNEWRTLWSAFFKGALTKVDLLASHPRVLFLNPIADVAVIAECVPDLHGMGKVLCEKLCAAPGEALGGETAERAPAWSHATDPVVSLRETARARLQAFKRLSEMDPKAASASAEQLCSQKAQAAGEVRMLDLLIASRGFSASEFSSAVGSYLAQRVSKPPLQGTDTAYDVLTREPGLAFSAAIPLPKKGWIVFLTPKSTGWEQALVLLEQQEEGRSLRVKSARVIAFTSI